MFAHCKLLGVLTPHQSKVLKSLFELENATPGKLCFPRDLGATRGSHHAKTLQSLVLLGFASRVLLAGAVRPQYRYQISPLGHQTWLEFRSMANLAARGVMGRDTDRIRARYALLLAA